MLYYPKSQPAPQSLEIEKMKVSGKYNLSDVLTRIKDDFKNKCYICGAKSTTLNIEHFIPHKGDNDLKFSWNNLFWACGHCNNLKNSKFDNILNCTDPADNCETKIKYIFKGFAYEKPLFEALDNDAKTLLTIELIKAVYEGNTDHKEIESANIKDSILNDFLDFQKNINFYYASGILEDFRQECFQRVIQHLHHSSEFTEFKRWVIRDSLIFYNDFGQYFR